MKLEHLRFLIDPSFLLMFTHSHSHVATYVRVIHVRFCVDNIPKRIPMQKVLHLQNNYLKNTVGIVFQRAFESPRAAAIPLRTLKLEGNMIFADCLKAIAAALNNPLRRQACQFIQAQAAMEARRLALGKQQTSFQQQQQPTQQHRLHSVTSSRRNPSAAAVASSKHILLQLGFAKEAEASQKKRHDVISVGAWLPTPETCGHEEATTAPAPSRSSFSVLRNKYSSPDAKAKPKALAWLRKVPPKKSSSTNGRPSSHPGAKPSLLGNNSLPVLTRIGFDLFGDRKGEGQKGNLVSRLQELDLLLQKPPTKTEYPLPYYG
jgi:hypothetical protein